MPDFLPRTDTDFDRWFENFIEYATRHAAELGLSAKELSDLRSHRDVWRSSLSRHQAAREKAKEATVVKEMARITGERAIRKYVRVIQARPATTNEQRQGLGITIKPEETDIIELGRTDARDMQGLKPNTGSDPFCY